MKVQAQTPAGRGGKVLGEWDINAEFTRLSGTLDQATGKPCKMTVRLGSVEVTITRTDFERMVKFFK